jgi:hypothetical protein
VESANLRLVEDGVKSEKPTTPAKELSQTVSKSRIKTNVSLGGNVPEMCFC